MRALNLASSFAPCRWLLGCALAGALLSACASSSPDTQQADDNVLDPPTAAEADASTGGKLDASVKKDASVKPAPDSGAASADAGKSDASVVSGLDGGKPDASAVSDARVSDGRVADMPVVDASADAGTVTPPAGDLCHLKGYDVAVLGDSYIQLSGDFTRIVEETARSVGALGATDTYVDHALSGASMNGTPNIPAQWPDAIADAKRRGGGVPKLVIMTGGGNDVLVNNRPCLDPTSVAAVEANATCVKVIDDTLATAQKLFDQAVGDGAKATIYFFYPHLPKLSIGAGPNANNILDYSIPKAKALCDRQTKAPCYFVDMRPAFDDPKNPGWPRDGLIAFDGIHPTLEGSKILAAEVWKVMQAECLGSK
ncbi:MAG: lysophospholipase [Myxococcaceae bacterium]|nr:lysophospholipase [Myxococcaceae bacterium]